MANISIIIPTFKESKTIDKLLNKIFKEFNNVKIIIVDDSPTNEIKDIIKKYKKIYYIFRGKKLGRGNAVLEGLKFALTNFKNNFFVEMDADLSHDPKEIKKKILKIKQSNSDLLVSSRYLKKSKIINWPLKRKIFSYLANSLAKLLLKVPITDYTNGYRIYSKRAAKHIIKNCGKIGDGFIVLSEIIVELYYNNFKIIEMDTVFKNRLRGQSSVNFSEIFNSLFGLIKIFNLKNKIKINK